MLIQDRLNCIEIDEDESNENQDEAPVGSASEPPKALVVTNLAPQIFDDIIQRRLFEETFLAVDECATFNYFKSFSRVRVNFSSSDFASSALHLFDLTQFAGQVVRCFLTQPIIVGSGAPHLMPPKREKQFLISPPASPPVGWEPIPEGQPLVSYDIIAAIADLLPGESHELHPPSVTQPGIIVHVCGEGEVGDGIGPRCPGVRLPQTARPADKPSAPSN